jgi:hypothetical protein
MRRIVTQAVTANATNSGRDVTASTKRGKLVGLGVAVEAAVIDRIV